MRSLTPQPANQLYEDQHSFLYDIMFYWLLSTYISFNIPQEPCELTKEDMIYSLVSEILCDFIMAEWLLNSQTQGFNSSALDKQKPPKFSSQEPGG